MNRSDFIDELAEHFQHLTKNDIELAVNTLLDAMQDGLEAGHRIEIRGFGCITVVHRAARTGRNPRNGDGVAMRVDAATVCWNCSESTDIFISSIHTSEHTDTDRKEYDSYNARDR